MFNNKRPFTKKKSSIRSYFILFQSQPLFVCTFYLELFSILYLLKKVGININLQSNKWEQNRIATAEMQQKTNLTGVIFTA